MFDEHLYAFHQLLTREGETVLSREEFMREWSVDEIYEMVIEGSDTDMIVAQPLPLTDLFHDGLSPWEKCAEMARKHPDRAVFWGSVNPLEGKKALDLMTRQVEDHGAKAFKFYNVRYDYGQPFPWRMDDPRVAYPVFERAQELGVNLIGVHKGVPLGPQPIEHTRTFDMDGAAANFPDINFVIFHVGLPWLDEVLWQIVRYPNLYASIAATVNFIARQPRVFAETLGKMLWWCGEDKIIYGGESPIWHPQWALEEFWNFELPRDIVEERGYPQLTEQAKRKILGENLARLHGIDVEAKKAELGCRADRAAPLGRPRARFGARMHAPGARRPRSLVRRRPWRVGFDERDQARAARALGNREAGVGAAGHGRAGSPSAAQVNCDSTRAWHGTWTRRMRPRWVTAPEGGRERRHRSGPLPAQRLVPAGASSSCCFRSLAAATTQRLYGVPFWPATCFLLAPCRPSSGCLPVATLAIAVTHRLKGVPFWPVTCFLLWPWHCLPYALALARRWRSARRRLGGRGGGHRGVAACVGVIAARAAHRRVARGEARADEQREAAGGRGYE